MNRVVSFRVHPVWSDICVSLGISTCSEFMGSKNGYDISNCEACKQKWFDKNTKLKYNTTLSDENEFVVQGNEEDILLFSLEYVQ